MCRPPATLIVAHSISISARTGRWSDATRASGLLLYVSSARRAVLGRTRIRSSSDREKPGGKCGNAKSRDEDVCAQSSGCRGSECRTHKIARDAAKPEENLIGWDGTNRSLYCAEELSRTAKKTENCVRYAPPRKRHTGMAIRVLLKTSITVHSSPSLMSNATGK
jgi:hypothetical protein